MDQERFDQLARVISTGSSRRKMLGGMVAGLFGVGAAKLGDVAAKGKHKQRNHKGAAKGKKGKGVHAEQTSFCTGATDPVNCPNGCCSNPAAGVFICQQNGHGFCGRGGIACVAQPAGTCCDPATGATVTPLPPGPGVVGQCGTSTVAGTATVPGNGGLCTPCPNGCCLAPDTGQFGTQCVANGSGHCGVNGVTCDGGSGCNPAVPGNGPIEQQCCTASGNCAPGTVVSQCGSSRHICEVCEPPNATCFQGGCQAGPPCPPPLSECGGICVDLGNNPQHCGTCSTVCPSCPTGSEAICVGGTCSCTSSCPVGLTECGGICVDLGSNPQNCGACGTVCPACGKGRKTTCEGGACGCTQKKKKRRRHHHH
jgi:hypothetical protein